jgi:hypothetical protein
MSLEEFKLFFGCLARCYNLHDRLELWIYSCSLGQHMNHGIGRWCAGWPWRGRRRFLYGLRWGRPWLWWLLLVYWLPLTVVLGVLIRLAMLRLVVIRPCPIRGRCGCFLGCLLHHLFGCIESDRERVGLDDQLCLYVDFLVRVLVRVSAQLRKVPQESLLSRPSCLILLCPVRRLLWLIEVLVEDSKVHARHPNCPRPIERCAEHATLLNVLPFRCR